MARLAIMAIMIVCSYILKYENGRGLTAHRKLMLKWKNATFLNVLVVTCHLSNHEMSFFDSMINT